MRVLHLIDSAGVYGAEIMLLSLVEAQRAEGILSEVGSIAAEGESERPLEKECDRRGIPCRRLRFSPAINVLAAARILKEIESDGIALLHAHGYKADILFGMLLCVARRVPMLTTVHGWTETRLFSKMGLYQVLDSISWGWMEQVVAVADDSPVYRAPRLKSKRMTIENGIALDNGNLPQLDPVVIGRMERHCKGRPCIGMVSRLSPEKGVDTMLSAISRLRGEGVDYAVVIAGEGPDRARVEQRIATDALAEHVLLIGYVEGASQLMPYFDLLAIPSRTEGLPMTLLEAMVSDVPVIASRVGQIPKVLEDGACGHLIDSGDDVELARGIRRLVEDKLYRDSLASRAKIRVISEYSMARTAKQYADLYRKLAVAGVCDRVND